MSELIPAEYATLLREVKERVHTAQYAALRAANLELVGLYWDIGRLIVGRQAGRSWGKAVVERLAADLQAEFPGIGGFSASNLWRMKAVFEAYADSEILAPLVREISWSHNLVILERCADPLEREFYIRMTKKFGWTKNVLIHQVENQSYEKTLLGQTNFDRAVTPAIRAQAKLAVRDEYTFDFLELGELIARDALHREESCGGHFREEYQTEDGEALRNDEKFAYVAAWEFKGVGVEPVMHKENLVFDYVKPSQRSYK